MPRGSRPGERRGGRQKGTPNKLTSAVKDMVLGALGKLGGEKWLIVQAEKNPVAFMSLLGRLVPHEFSATSGSSGGGPLSVLISYPLLSSNTGR